MSECKYQLLEDLVSYDDGGLWESQNPPVYLKGNLIEPDSPDCDGYDGYLERWIPVDGGYICEGNNKYIKEILQISNDGGVTWYPSNPLASRTGEFVKVDEEFCSYLFEGQYVYSGDSSGGGGGGCTSQPCPSGYYWSSDICGCFTKRKDPLKIIKCNGKTEITSNDTLYYDPNNWYLQSAKIGGCAVSIGDRAFSSANRTKTVSSITFTDATSLTTIGSGAFSGCTNLTSIELPNSVTSIGSYAFQECSNLTRLNSSVDGTFNILSGVTSIGRNAFNNCTSISSITVNATVPPSLGTGAFDNTNDCPIYVPCQSIIDYKTADGWVSYRSRLQGVPSPCTPTPTGTTKLYATYSDGDIYFKYCDSDTVLTTATTQPTGYQWAAMTSAVIGDCVATIGENAFGSEASSAVCKSLTSVTIPNSVVVISSQTFANCSGLTSINIPDSVTTIGNRAFEDCRSLTSCTIGSGITYIDERAFYGCDGLQSITINATTPPVLYMKWPGPAPFDYTNGCPIYVPCESVDAYKAASVWKNHYAGRILGIPPCDRPVKYRATYSNGGVYNLDCDSRTTLTSGNTRGGDTSLTAMTNAEVGSCVTAIGDEAFEGFYMTSITISDSVTSIGNRAFRYCQHLTSLTCLATVPPSLGGSAFTHTSDFDVYVPCESVDAYRAAWFPHVFSSRIQAIPGSCTKFSATYSGGQTYSAACDSSTELTTGTTKPSGYECTAMTSAVVGSCVTSIGDYAFGSYSLDEVCTSLSSITIPDSITSIGNNAFANCSGLTSVVIPSGVTSIGGGCFYGCTSLASITVNATTPPTLSFGWEFDNTNDCPIYVPASSVSAYQTAWSTYASRIQPIT